MQVIAEVKKASPSAGVMKADFDPAAVARLYEQHGAACVSVLTDGPFFQGSLADLEAVRAAVALPILRKDFILDRIQLLEARAAGADAVLLIAEVLDDAALSRLLREARELGLQTLVELYDHENLPRVLDAGARLVGVNNRDLRTFDDAAGTHAGPGREDAGRRAVWSARAASARGPTWSACRRPASAPCWWAKR